MSAGLLLVIVGAALSWAALVIMAPTLPTRQAVRMSALMAVASLLLIFVGRWIA